MGDSQSQFTPDNISQQGELEVDEVQVEDASASASVRALRPRSSRRGSWESEASGWSARVAMVKERSLKAGSWKTGAQTDGDGSADATGEEIDEGKGTHAPSPLAANGFTTADTMTTTDEATTPPAKEFHEIKVLEFSIEADGPGKDVHHTVPSHAEEVVLTPTKKALGETDGSSGELEEDLTQKLPAKEKDVHLAGPRTLGAVEDVN